MVKFPETHFFHFIKVRPQVKDEDMKRGSKLPDQEQDAMAAIVLEELASAQRWSEYFANSRDKLARLALAEYDAGVAKPL
ncbi:MAG: hypothetical protein EXR27_21695 [Betaproteobacteria bacterium]|nr:hypothetical protein [Betaproteobacteria bacterium]